MRETSLTGALQDLNFEQGDSPAHLLNAFLYEDKAKIYHNKTGEFAAIFALEPYDSLILDEGGVRSIRARLKNLCNTLTPECTASITRFTLPDIKRQLDAYKDGHAESMKSFENDVAAEEWWGKNAFADDIESSMIERYKQAVESPQGFMMNVSTADMNQAIREYASEINDAELAEKILQNGKEADLFGMRPTTHGHWFILKWTPSYLLGKGIHDLSTLIKSKLGLMTVAEIEKKIYGTHVSQFMKLVSGIRNALTASQLHPRFVEVDEYINTMYRIFNPNRSIDHRVAKYTRNISIGDVINGGKILRHEDIAENIAYAPITMERNGASIQEPCKPTFYYRAVSLVGRLGSNKPAMIHHAIDTINLNGWTTVNFHATPYNLAWARIKFRQNMFLSKMMKKKSKEKPITSADEKTSAGLQHIEEALKAPVLEDRDTMFEMSVHTVLGSEDRLAVDSTAEHLATSGYWNLGAVEQIRGEAVFYSSLPLNYFKEQNSLMRRHQPYMSEAVGNFFPLYAHFKGVESSGILFANRHGSPIFIDIFGDATKTGHGLVVGTTGTGKSFVTNYLLASVICKYNPLIRIFDKGGSYQDLCQNLSGDYVELGTDTFKSSVTGEDIEPSCLNPLHIETDPMTNKLRMPKKKSINAMAYQLVAMRSALLGKLGDVKDDFSILKLNLLVDALNKFFTAWVSEHSMPPILSEFAKFLSKHNLGDLNGEVIALELSMFYGDGTYAKVFDGQLTFSWNNPFIVIETNGLSGDPLLGAIVVNLLRQISDDLIFNAPLLRKKIIAIDEAWSALANPQGAEMLAEFFRTLRKNNCGVILISQFLSDFVKILKAEGDGGDDGILANTSHFFFLPSKTTDFSLAREHLAFSEQATRMWEGLSGAYPFYSEIFYSLKNVNDTWQHGILRYVASPLIYWLSSTRPDDRNYRIQLTRKFVSDGDSHSDARKNAVVQAAKIYPFGKRFPPVTTKQARKETSHAEAA